MMRSAMETVVAFVNGLTLFLFVWTKFVRNAQKILTSGGKIDIISVIRIIGTIGIVY